MEVGQFLNTLDNAIDLISKQDFMTKKMRMALLVQNLNFMQKFMFNENGISEILGKQIVNVSNLIEKNKVVFDNELISIEEYNNNGKKLLTKLVKILNPTEKKKKASKIDVYSLRAGLATIDNEN